MCLERALCISKGHYVSRKGTMCIERALCVSKEHYVSRKGTMCLEIKGFVCQQREIGGSHLRKNIKPSPWQQCLQRDLY
jgi:hypothetical protein